MEPRRALSEADYLSLSPGELRRELVNGEVYAMGGGSPRHAAVTANLIVALTLATRGRPCRPTSPDQRVYVAETGAYLYPDVALVCGPFLYSAGDAHSLVNPSVLVEVLSPSTGDYDQGAKFDHYRRLPTLRHYVLVDPAARHVVHHARMAEGWLRRDLEDGDLVLLGLDVRVPLDAIYADLDAVDGLG
ncbi:MAG: Uma2 family endonuclease [Myxococcota bacterium]